MSSWQSLLVAPPLEPSLSRLARAVHGKTVLITGASFGIGQATAKHLALAGATVLLLARTQEKLDVVAKEIRAGGGTAFVYAIDLTDLSALRLTLTQILLEHPRIDLIICNAGKSIRRKITDSLDRSDTERLIQLNFTSPSTLVLTLLPQMLGHGGQIINVSTISVRLPGVPMWAAYQGSKTGFDKWLCSLGNELRLQNIVISSVYLPLVRTRMSSAVQFKNVPALSPIQAVQTIAYAVVQKVSRVAPWWLRWLEVTAVLFEAPSNWILTRLFVHSSQLENQRKN